MRRETVYFCGRSDAAPVTTRGMAGLKHDIADEASRKEAAVHPDAVKIDEALGKGSHSRAVLTQRRACVNSLLNSGVFAPRGIDKFTGRMLQIPLHYRSYIHSTFPGGKGYGRAGTSAATTAIRQFSLLQSGPRMASAAGARAHPRQAGVHPRRRGIHRQGHHHSLHHRRHPRGLRHHALADHVRARTVPGNEHKAAVHGTGKVFIGPLLVPLHDEAVHLCGPSHA